MSEQDKVLLAIEDYRKAEIDLQKALGRDINSPNFDLWITEVKTGQILDSRLYDWIVNLINYYGEKDRSFATYMESLLK